jgi:hypothetical protein
LKAVRILSLKSVAQSICFETEVNTDGKLS